MKDMPLSLVDTATGEIVDQKPEFGDFWALYCKRVAKADARKAWSKLKPAQQLAALVACVAWARVWANTDYQFLPYPATWLRAERWEDELPPEYRQTHASHVPAIVPAQEARTVMPEHVRAALARLRAKNGS